jgi:D-serine deaminase-like pyridoxal phosphate-dependent protein
VANNLSNVCPQIVAQEYITFMGVYSHSGHAYDANSAEEAAAIALSECDIISRFVEKLEAEGVTCSVVSIGATPSLCHLPPKERMSRVTEIHPGNYVFFDRTQVDIGRFATFSFLSLVYVSYFLWSSCKLEDVAVKVITRVLSHYPTHFMIDAGALALSKVVPCSVPVHSQKKNQGLGSIPSLWS